MLKKAILFTLVVTLLVTPLVGCGNGGGGGNGDASGEPIVIGAFGPLSGGAAMVGDTMMKGIELAMKEFNDAGGINGRPLELIKEDDEQNPAKAVSAVNKLVHSDNVPVVIGTVNSSATLAAMEVTQEAKVPHITPISSNTSITHLGNPYIYRLQISDENQAGEITRYAINELGFTRIGVMYQNDDFGSGGKDVVVRVLQEAGIEPIAVESFVPDAKDMTSQLLKIQEGDPEAIIMWTMYQQGALIARQVQQLGMDIQLMGGGGLTNEKIIELAGDAVYGLLNTQPFFPDPDKASPKAAEFISNYQAAYGMLPDSNAAMAYDSMLTLGEALKNCGDNVTSEEINNQLKKVQGLEGATGTINIDENGDTPRSVLIVKINDQGEYEVVDWGE